MGRQVRQQHGDDPAHAQFAPPAAGDTWAAEFRDDLIRGPCHNFVQRRAIGAERIGLPSLIFISKGDSANDYAIVSEIEVLMDKFRM